MTETIPVVLFAYARPRRLLMTLECLRANHVPLIYAFADGPKTSQDSQKVASVREILRAIDWCEVALCELALGVRYSPGFKRSWKSTIRSSYSKMTWSAFRARTITYRLR